MIVKLYNTYDQINIVQKVITAEVEYTCTAREEISITAPVIYINGDVDLTKNFAYIPEFNRYYFIDDNVMVRNGLWMMSLRVDVLMSFQDEIMEQTCLVSRQEFLNNHYLDDELCQFYAQKIISTQKIPAVKGFIDGVLPNILLTTLG